MMMIDDEAWLQLVSNIEDISEFMTASQDRTVKAIEIKKIYRILRKQLRKDEANKK
jgi:hypothetical protein